MPPRPFLRTIGKVLQDTPHASVAVSSRPFLCSFPTIYPGEEGFSLAGEELRRVPGWSCQDLGLALRSFCPGWDSLSDPLRVPTFWVTIVLEQIHRSKEPGSREILSLCQKPNILLKGRKN